MLIRPHIARGSNRSLYLLGVVLGVLLVSLSACTSSILAGGNWQSSALQNKHIHVITVDPNNPQNIYAGSDQGAIFASTDGGQHWLARNTGLPVVTAINVLTFDSPGKKLYAATGNGIFVSADGAQHWNSVGPPSSGLPRDNYTALAFDLNNVHIIYAGTANHGVLVSKDGGTSWSSASSDVPFHRINSLAFDSSAHRLWAATDVGIYRSDDGGTTWQAFNSGLPANLTIYTVQPAAISGGLPDLVFAGTNHGFFISQNAGAQWATSQEPFPGLSVYQLLVDFQTPTTVFAATSVGAFRSDDSGQNWGVAGPGLPGAAPVYALALGATNYSQLYAAANNVYLFPGTSGGVSVTNLLPTLLVVIFFYLLYRLVMRGRRKTREMLKVEQDIESPTSTPEPSSPNGLVPYKAVPEDKDQSNNLHPIDHKQEVSSEGEEGEQ